MHWEKKADEHKNDGQGGKRKTTGKVHGCSDGGHAKGWCDTCQRSWRQMISCGDPLKKAAGKKEEEDAHNKSFMQDSFLMVYFLVHAEEIDHCCCCFQRTG